MCGSEPVGCDAKAGCLMARVRLVCVCVFESDLRVLTVLTASVQCPSTFGLQRAYKSDVCARHGSDMLTRAMCALDRISTPDKEQATSCRILFVSTCVSVCALGHVVCARVALVSRVLAVLCGGLQHALMRCMDECMSLGRQCCV